MQQRTSRKFDAQSCVTSQQSEQTHVAYCLTQCKLFCLQLVSKSLTMILSNFLPVHSNAVEASYSKEIAWHWQSRHYCGVNSVRLTFSVWPTAGSELSLNGVQWLPY